MNNVNANIQPLAKNYKPALGFHFLTQWYDAVIQHTMPERKIRAILLDLIWPVSNQTILEFGCGTGQNLLLGAVRNKDVVWEGVDVDSKVIAIARKKTESIKNIRLHLYDGNSLPALSRSIDTVFSSLVFHHLTANTKQTALCEISRVLKPGGKLVIADWGKPQSKWSRYKFLLVQLLDGFATTRDNVKGLVPDFIRQAGFVGVEEAEVVEPAFGSFVFYTAFKPGAGLFAV